MMSEATLNKNTQISIARKVSTVLADRNGKPSRVQADAAGKLPTRFELLKVGMWRTPRHGDIMITPDDLQEYVDNFHEGYGVSGNGELGLPINFGHESEDKAAGWFKDMVIEGDTLFADKVTWSDSGKAGLLGNEWKCISAEFYPAGRGGWPNPLDDNEWIENVIDGAALTNIPLFSQLKPVMASAVSGKANENNQVFFIKASEHKEKDNMPTLEEVRAKEAATLTEEDKTLLAEHKSELTAEEQTKFGFEVTAKTVETPAEKPEDKKIEIKTEETPVVNTQEVAPELAQVAASIKSGESVVIKASTLKHLEDTANQYQTEKAETIVKAHIARGAVKADSMQKWVDKVLADKDGTVELLESIPDNQLLADTKGKTQADAEFDTNDRDKVVTRAQEIVKASKEAGKEVPIQEAVKQANSELRQATNENK